MMAVSTATCTAAKPEVAHILEKQISELFCLHPSKCKSKSLLYNFSTKESK